MRGTKELTVPGHPGYILTYRKKEGWYEWIVFREGSPARIVTGEDPTLSAVKKRALAGLSARLRTGRNVKEPLALRTSRDSDQDYLLRRIRGLLSGWIYEENLSPTERRTAQLLVKRGLLGRWNIGGRVILDSRYLGKG